MWLAKKSPEELIRYMYRQRMRREIDLENPRTFNEKLNWLKLYYYNENEVICSDKYTVRQYIIDKGLGHLLVPLCGKGIYDSFDDINFDELPDKFVLKATHDSGHLFLCNDKSKFNKKLAKIKLNWWLKIDYAYLSGEWPYHSDNHRIICEEMLEDTEHGEIYDYKFLCFNGEPDSIFFASGRATGVHSDFYDLEWNKLPFRWLYPPTDIVFDRPKCLKQMIEYARILSEGFPFARVDFYEVNGRVYAGEITFFHGGALGWFKPEEKDYEYGEKIVLPDEKVNAWKLVGLKHHKMKLL